MSRTRLIFDFLARGRPFRYGPHSSQCADLHLPRAAGPHPVMVLVHGGSWHRRYGKLVMRGLAGDLARRGWAVWNIEYRRLGEGGGWPQTFADVAAAVDHLGQVDMSLDLDRVGVLGHSAGGHLALWAAGRDRLPPDAPGADPKVPIASAIGMAAVADLAGAYALWRGGAPRALMGGGPEHRPERYAVGDPMAVAPLAIPVLLVHGVHDRTVSIELARRYARRAARGGLCELVEIDGEAGAHRAHLDPRGPAWASVTRRLGEPAAVA